MDTAFLTGGTGFVGANLVRLLIEQGFQVKALARPGSDRRNLDGLAVELVTGDLLDRAALAAGCAGARYVFHVAADYRIWVPDPEPMRRVNVEGSVKVVQAAAAAGAERIVYCSSVAAIMPPHGRTPADETSRYPGADAVPGDYKKSKYLAELAVLELAAKGAPVVAVNPAAPIGPWDRKPTPTGKILVDFLNGRMPSYIDTGLCVVHVRDVALGHLLAARQGRVGERYILGGENLTFKQILDILSELTGRPAPRFKTPYAVAYAFAALDTAVSRLSGREPRAPLDAVRMARHYMWYDSAKARKELGYAPVPARQALADAAAWFQANGYARAAA
ncbi:MAG: NAD-dependent epimerase/dehydratase family protein [Elusimicrobia bacterium]|jgi:dihydroflavonol-4-reductase|nr:NAD-dependent epimerase/dehydratase family protein [Elusimicrobiota bacterium]